MKKQFSLAIIALSSILVLGACGTASEDGPNPTILSEPTKNTPEIPIETEPVEKLGEDGIFIGKDIPGHEHYSGEWHDLVESGKSDKESESLAASWRTEKKDAAATTYLKTKWSGYYDSPDEIKYWLHYASYGCQYLYDGYSLYSIDQDISDAKNDVLVPNLSIMTFYCDSTLEEYFDSNDEINSSSVWSLDTVRAPESKN